ATTRGWVAASTVGRYFSSTSSTAIEASGAWPSAAVRPASMFAPNALEATSCPSAPSAAVMSRVVVVFPLVPVTSTTWRSAASRASRWGSTRRPMTPPITDPSPRPARRDILPAAPPMVVARRARNGSLPMADDAIPPPDLRGTPAGRPAAGQGRSRSGRPVDPGREHHFPAVGVLVGSAAVGFPVIDLRDRAYARGGKPRPDALLSARIGQAAHKLIKSWHRAPVIGQAHDLQMDRAARQATGRH